MVKAFAEASNKLTTPGEISPVVETEFGFHVIKLIENTPERQRSFDEISTDLLLTLRRNFIDAQVDQYSGEFRGKPVQANPDLVASLRTRYANSKGDSAPTADTTGAKPIE
jgi:parvulin-like peptidyl-prolyl isomerase